jgi:hypothetical protein
MANSGLFDESRSVNQASLDTIVQNERSRATLTPVTLTAAIGTPTSYTTNALGTNWMAGFGAPRTLSSATGGTIDAGDLMTGIITIKNTNTSTSTFTFDTAANMVSAVNSCSAGAVIGDYIQCLIINSTGSGAGGTLTLAAGSGGSFDANQSAPIVAVGTSRYVFVRLTNVTGGSESYVIYT